MGALPCELACGRALPDPRGAVGCDPMTDPVARAEELPGRLTNIAMRLRRDDRYDRPISAACQRMDEAAAELRLLVDEVKRLRSERAADMETLRRYFPRVAKALRPEGTD